MIRSYFEDVKEKTKELQWILLSESVDFEVLSEDFGILKGALRFINGDVLELMELVSRGGHYYRFHWMDAKKRLITRWDNAPHHKEVSTHPFHMHEPDGAKESEDMWLLDVLDIVKSKIIEGLEKGRGEDDLGGMQVKAPKAVYSVRPAYLKKLKKIDKGSFISHKKFEKILGR